MGLGALTSRLATILVLQAAGAGLATTILVTRPEDRPAEYLPTDNQTMYRLGEGESRNLELNTSSISQRLVFITVSPCSRDLRWALYQGVAGGSDGHLSLSKEYIGLDMSVFTVVVSLHNRYVLQLSSARGGAAVVSVRGEASRPVRLRLRVRSRRRLAANWEPSPIDPQATAYCVVVSYQRNYTSLCAAQFDLKSNRIEKPCDPTSYAESDRSKTNRIDNITRESSEIDNKIETEFNIYDGNLRGVYRRKKFGRSTKATDGDPIVACLGEKTHHVIENLDPSMNYFVSVFGISRDRRAGSLLATGVVRPRTSTAKRLQENVPSKAVIRGRVVYYFKAAVGAGGGLWLTLTTCGGAVDVEVLVRGKRLYTAKNIEPHSKFFVPAPIPTSSIQETSDEGSVQFDSSSEEARMRYVIRVIPSRAEREAAVGVELTVSTRRWGARAPELAAGGAAVRELRARRACRALEVAFLPAHHNATDVIRYCITSRENINGVSYVCTSPKKSPTRTQCSDHLQRPPQRVIIQKINGLKPGRKYAIQVTASNRGSPVPYNILYADTNTSCKEDLD